MKTTLSLCLGFCLAVSAMAQIAINPTSRSFAKEGGGGSVLTSGSGTWTASTAASWIAITPKTSGTAGESCIYVVSANFSADTRQGVVVIGGNNHTVNQSGYNATLSPTDASFDYEGGSTQASIVTEAGVSWTATSNSPWVTVSPSSGTSVGTVTITVAPYGGVTTRTASLTIAGKTFSVTQTGLDVNISPFSKEFDYETDIVQVQVSALWNTSWSVTPNASWISVVDAGSGAGDSTVTLAVGTNPSYTMRTGTVSIGSATFTITQRGTSQPTLAILPPTATAEAVGAYGNVAVLASPDAPWTAQSLDPWIVVSQGATGSGNGNIQYVVSSNPDLVERVGRILVRPPVYEAPANLSWQLLAHVNSSEKDVSGWNHHLTGSLAERFNGTFSRTMTGDPFARNSDAFSLAFWFNIGNPDTINRLLQAERASNSFTAVYVDASNRLVVQCGAEMFVTDLTVEPNVEYQVVLAANVGRTLNVYAGKRGETMAAVGAKTFSVAPFPTSYITPERIKIGASDYPNAGYLDDATVNDFRVYGRELSAYEAQTLMTVAGTSTPYGEFSHTGDPAAVRVEYNMQGQAVVAGGANPPVVYTPTLSQFSAETIYLSGYQTIAWHDRKVHRLGGQFVRQIRGVGFTASSSRNIEWRYRLEYSDGTTWESPIRIASSSVTSTETNPNPWKPVDRIVVRIQATASGSSGDVSLTSSLLHWIVTGPQNLYGWELDSDRYGLSNRALKGTSKSRIVLLNHQSSFVNDSATYNFWVRCDAFPTSGVVPIFTRTGFGDFRVLFSCELQADGALCLTVNGTARSYAAPFELGKWHMLTVAADYGQSTRFYVNGEEIGNDPVFRDYRFGTDSYPLSMQIGGWEGAIGYAGFYDGALTSPQIKAIYDKQKQKDLYHVVTQGVVTPSIAPATASVPAAGGTVSSTLTLAQNVNWTAETATSWLQITSPSSGAGSTTVEVLAAANPSVYERQGTVTIAGKTFTVSQAGLGASVDYDETVFGTDGGSAWVDVSTEGNAQWQAVSQVSWLTVAIGASGSGAGSVFIVADPYTQTSSSRIGGVLIAGQMVYFTQRGFELSVVPQVAQVGSNAGAGEFGVVAPIGAIWEAIATHPWITIMGGTTGQGNGTLRYSVAANTTGESRTGKIIVSGREYTITQLASLLLTAYTDGGGTVGGSGSYETLATATVTATPASGYVFSHWTGDAVGSENPLTLSMDSSKTVKAHFLEVDIADSIALDSRERLGLYTPDQMEDLALGNPVLRMNPDSGKMSLFMGVLQRQSLTEGDWADVPIQGADVFIEGGKVRVDITPSGNAAFYRLKGGSGE